MSQTVLVTGATGLLGPPLVRQLRKAGFRVVAAGFKKKADVNFDLRDAAETARQLKAAKPDVVVHLAAETSVDRCEEQPVQAFDLNVRPVESLVQAISGTTAKLVNVSTDQLYDGAGPHSESAVRTRNMYSTSKYFSELCAARVGATNLRVDFFGKSETPGRPSASDAVLATLREQRQYNGFTDILFSPLSLPTLARMIERVVANPVEGTFNLGSREGMSKCDFAYQLAEAFKLPLALLARTTSSSVTFKAYRPKDMRMDVSLFEKIFAQKLPTLGEEIPLAEDLV